MKVIVVGLIAIAVIAIAGSQAASKQAVTCKTGMVKGFLAMRQDPPFLPGTVPSTFTDDVAYLASRYNCTRQSAQIRRLDVGTFDVRFPGLHTTTAVVTATPEEGAFASVSRVEESTFRIVVRGPIVKDSIIPRRDVSFTIVVY